MKFRQTAKFTKELKRLKKKYKSLDSDLTKFKKVLEKFPTGIKSKNWAILKRIKKVTIVKSRLSCAYLKRRSFRIVYAYNEKDQVLKFIDFLELYCKNDQESEDKENIKNYLKDIYK